MVHHSSPEAGAFRIASSANQHADAKHLLQGHANDLRLAHASFASANQPPEEGSLYVSSISEITSPASTKHSSSLDSQKSLSDLVRSGSIIDARHDGDSPVRERAGAGKAASITVRFSDIGRQSGVRADFIVRQDGQIEMKNNPEELTPKEIVIEVDRANGQLMPCEAQQASVDDLFVYLDSRIKSTNYGASEKGVVLNDPQDLVSDSIEQRSGARSIDQAPAGFPPQVEQQMRRMNRFKGGGSGQMSHGEADAFFPERSVRRHKSENDSIAAMKDVLAGFTSKGSARPYEHVVHRGERGFGIGRYGLTFDMLSSWLSGVDIDGLEELERHGKVPKGTAARMKRMKTSLAKSKESGKESDLDPFLQRLKSGDKNNPVNPQDISANFGKELQELACDYNVGRFADRVGGSKKSVEPGELALALMLGRVPTAGDLDRSENKRFVDAATQSYQIAINRFGVSPADSVDFADTSRLTSAMKSAVGKQLWQGYASATEHGNLGCAITVSRILRAGGLDIGDELSVDGVAAKMKRLGAERVSLQKAVASGRPYVIIKKHGGSHTGLGVGDIVVENSSDLRRTVSRSLSNSTLKSGSYAYIIPSRDA